MANVEKKRQAHLNKLFKIREELPGYKIIKELESLGRTYYTVENNFIDLINYINKCKNELIFEIFENGEVANTTELENLRLLHNYLSSIQTLIDHIRKTNRNINNDKLNDYFDAEMINFLKNDCVVFIKNFRNYTQHFSIPLLQQQFQIYRSEGITMEAIRARDADFKFELFINKEELLKWDRWNIQSKKYINKCLEEKELRVIITEYHDINKKHYVNYRKKINIIYNDEIMSVNNMNDKINKII